MYKPLKLTKKTAKEIIGKALGIRDISGCKVAPGVYRYTASIGCLEIMCENDWLNHNGRYKLTISDPEGGSAIKMYFHPDTMNRDFGEEQADKDDERQVARRNWVQSIGKERAHALVDKYWEG